MKRQNKHPSKGQSNTKTNIQAMNKATQKQTPKQWTKRHKNKHPSNEQSDTKTNTQAMNKATQKQTPKQWTKRHKNKHPSNEQSDTKTNTQAMNKATQKQTPERKKCSGQEALFAMFCVVQHFTWTPHKILKSKGENVVWKWLKWKEKATEHGEKQANKWPWLNLVCYVHYRIALLREGVWDEELSAQPLARCWECVKSIEIITL